MPEPDTIPRLDSETTRIVRSQLASGNPDIGLLWELCLRVEYERAVLSSTARAVPASRPWS